jgi:hypothetical protein
MARFDERQPGVRHLARSLAVAVSTPRHESDDAAADWWMEWVVIPALAVAGASYFAYHVGKFLIG